MYGNISFRQNSLPEKECIIKILENNIPGISHNLNFNSYNNGSLDGQYYIIYTKILFQKSEKTSSHLLDT